MATWGKSAPNRTEHSIRWKASKLGIASTGAPTWTKIELEKLQEYYGKISNEELQKTYLPGRTIPAIVGKAGLVDIRLIRSPAWTKEDDEILKKYYGRVPNKELQEKYLPGRTKHAIKMKARILGVASKRRATGANEKKIANPDSANRTSVLLSTIHSSDPFSDWLAQNTGLLESSIAEYSMQ